MEQLRIELANLKEAEEELCKTHAHALEDPQGSPRGVAGVTTEDTSKENADADPVTTIQRYEEARDLYLQRRLENLLVDHVSTYDPEAGPALEQALEFPIVPTDEESKALQERHDQVLQNLLSLLGGIDSQVHHLKDLHAAIAGRRTELECQVQDLEDPTHTNTNNTDEDVVMEKGETVQDEDLAQEQNRIDALQETKRQLRQQLAKLKQETEETKQKTLLQDKHLANLQTQANPVTDSLSTHQKKVQELKEIKAFYDSLRGVLEEVGGVKIDSVKEDPVKRRLYLTLLCYDTFSVEVELQVYRETFLQVVNARWLGDPTVHSTDQDTARKESLSLKLGSLDDLVQIAKTTLSPPHDLRFFVRETLARIRIQQARVQDLNILRQQVLTKIHNGNQIVCSLNEGIIVVMRLYERHVRVEQIIGVSGWTEAATQRIHDAIPADDVFHPMKPTEVFQCVLQEMEGLKSDGKYPQTPHFPVRKGGF